MRLQRRSTPPVLAAAVAVVLAHPAAVRAAGPADQATIHDLEAKRQQAMLAADQEALRSLLADDLTYTHASGVEDTKASFLGAISSGKKYLAIDRTEEHIRVYGTVAVVTGRVSIHTQWAPAAPSTAKLLFTDVWTRQADGRWQVVAWQSTRQPEVAAAPSPRPSP